MELLAGIGAILTASVFAVVLSIWCEDHPVELRGYFDVTTTRVGQLGMVWWGVGWVAGVLGLNPRK